MDTEKNDKSCTPAPVRPGNVLPGLIVAVLFFFAGVLSLNDFGITYDETVTYRAALMNYDILTGALPAGIEPYSRHELPGYHFFIDTARGFFAKAMTALGVMDLPTSFHFFHLVLSSLAVYLLYHLVLAVSGRVRTAFLSALTLSLFPKFIAHSQNNPKDLTGLFFFVLSLYLVTVWMQRGRMWRSFAAGLVLGISFTTHIITIFVPVIAGMWLALCRRETLRLNWRRGAVVIGVALGAFFLFWPWLWTAPLQRLVSAYKIISTFSVKMSVLYFGQLYPWTGTPWHYFLGSLAVTTPVLYLFLAVPAMFIVLSRRSDLHQLRETALLGLLWCAVLVLADLTSRSHYDGIRHFLALLPGFSLLAGVGGDALLMRSTDLVRVKDGFARLRYAAPAVLCVVWLLTAFSIARTHPYEDAYLNEATNAVLPGPAEDYFEIEYWGNTYREAAAWLNKNGEPDAVFYYVWSDQSNFYLTRPAAVFDPALFFNDTSRPRYLMLMSRTAFYDNDLKKVSKDYRPVYTIARQKGTLLKIYKNTVKRERA